MKRLEASVLDLLGKASNPPAIIIRLIGLGCGILHGGVLNKVPRCYNSQPDSVTDRYMQVE